MALDPAMAALAARTAAQWRAEQGPDERFECAPTCVYCQRPATIESAIGLDGSCSEPNALGQRRYIAPRPEHRCEECQAGFERVAKRERRLAQEGWI